MTETLSEKARKHEVANILAKLKSGKTLTGPERRLIREHEERSAVGTWEDVAKHVGASLRSVHMWRKEKDSPQNADLSAWSQWCEQKGKLARGAKGNSPDFNLSRARKMQAEAELAEIKLAAAKRDNLPRIEVEEQLIRICRALQVGLDALAGELPPIIAGMDAPAMEPHIKRAHRLLCNAWADGAAEIVGGDWKPPSFDELRENQPK
jgi:hypothetical protein